MLPWAKKMMAVGHKAKQPQRSGMATVRFALPSPAERTASLFSIRSPLSSPSEKNTPSQNTKQPERELKCQNMNLRASEVASLPLPVFRLMLIWAHWGCTGERMRWQQLMLLQENTSFSTEQRGCTGESLLSLQAACATILDGAETAGGAWICPIPLSGRLQSREFPHRNLSWAPKCPPKLLQHQSLAERGKTQWAGSDKGGLGFWGYWCHTENLYHQNEKNKNLSMTLGSYLTSAFCTICRAEIRMGGGCKNPKIKGSHMNEGHLVRCLLVGRRGTDTNSTSDAQHPRTPG